MLTTAPQLETDRLILRAHTVKDFEACAAMWADERVVRHISGVPSTGEASWSRLLRYAGHWQLLGYGYWAVELKASGAFIGEVGFADYKREMEPSLGGGPEAGWVLTPNAHGQGYASEAVRFMTDWADGAMDWPSSVCIVDPDHAASIRVARKAGYRDLAMAQYQEQPTLVMERMRHGA